MRVSAVVYVRYAACREESGRICSRGCRERAELPRLDQVPDGLQPRFRQVQLQGVQGEGDQPGPRLARRYERDARNFGRGRRPGSFERQQRPRFQSGAQGGHRGSEKQYERLYHAFRRGIRADLERRTAQLCLQYARVARADHSEQFERRCDQSAPQVGRRCDRELVQRAPQPYRPFRRYAAQYSAFGELGPHSGRAAGREGARARAQTASGYGEPRVLGYL